MIPNYFFEVSVEYRGNRDENMILMALILTFAVGLLWGIVLGIMAEQKNPGYNASPFSDEPDPRRYRAKGGPGLRPKRFNRYPGDSTGARKHDPSVGSEDDVQ